VGTRRSQCDAVNSDDYGGGGGGEAAGDYAMMAGGERLARSSRAIGPAAQMPTEAGRELS
jgi:hypothetical protein